MTMPRRIPALDARLTLVASLVRQGSRLADIGADHGRLAVHLALTGAISHGLCCDISPGSLQKSIDLIRRYGLEETLETRLGDGLQPVAPQEVDDIVIAGMGGETIASIIKAWAGSQDSDKGFVLQPMTGAEALRDFLWREGFAIRRELCALAGGRPYTAMAVNYTGVRAVPNLLQLYLGGIDDFSGEAARLYLKKTAVRLRKQARGRQGDRDGYAQTAAQIEKLIE